MSLRDSRLTRALCGSVAPLLAGVCFVACTAQTGEPTSSTTSEAVSGDGVLHSHVTRQSWHRQASHHQGRDDGDDRCRPASLAICPLLDSEVGIATDAGGCATSTGPQCPDRVDTWDNEIVFDFAMATSGDCRFGQWAPPLLTDTDVVNFLNDLLGFTLQFFDCPLEGTTDKLTFGLFPSALDGHRFTTADLEALTEAYTAAVAQALSDFGAAPLSNAQMTAIEAKLHRLARHVPNVVRSHRFTFSTCAPGTAPPADDDSIRDDNSDCH